MVAFVPPSGNDLAFLATWPMDYMGHYTMLSKYGNCTRLLKIRNKLKIGCLYK